MSPTIISIEARSLSLPLREPLATSLHTYAALACVFVLVKLSDGSEGVGEARESLKITGETSDGMCDVIKHHLAPALVGREAGDLEGAHAAMTAAAVGHTAARSAIDIALHDARGHSLGLSVGALLGGSHAAPVASSKAISVGDTAAMVDQARRFVAAGFGTLKIKTGLDAPRELSAVHAIRAEVGPEVKLKLDANQGWSLPEATRFLERAAAADIHMVEQPLPAWDLAGSAELRRRSPVPVMLDEAVQSPQDAFRALDMGACDYINIKLLKTGGLHPALKLVAVAESAGAACQVGTLDSSVGSAAAVHLVRSRQAFRFAEINGPSRLEEDVATGFHLKDGYANVAAAPGLGLDLDLDKIGFAKSP